MHCEHEHEDGAYVLGALSPAERIAYERHLATCSFCREAVRDISTLPDLLARLDVREFDNLVDPTLSNPRTTKYRATGRRAKARALRVRVLSTAATAVFVIVVSIGVVLWTRGSSPATPASGPALAMTAVDSNSPIAAMIRLTSKSGGTKVEMVCSYSTTAAAHHTFRLMAYGAKKEKEQIGSWTPSPGTEFAMDAMTHFDAGSLSRLELMQYDGKVLLAYDVP